MQTSLKMAQQTFMRGLMVRRRVRADISVLVVTAQCVGVVVFSEEQNADVIFTFSFLFVLKTMGRL